MDEPIEDVSQTTLQPGITADPDALAAITAAEAGDDAPPATPEPPAGDAEVDTTAAAPSDDGEKKYTLDDLLVETGLESKDDVKSTLEYLNGIKDKLKGADLDKVLEQASKLQEYEKTWAVEDELKLRENETPDETIARLESKNEELANAEQIRLQQENQDNETRQTKESYDKEVSKVLSGVKDLDPRVQQFLTDSLSSEAEANNVNPGDLGSVRKMVANSVAAFDALKRGIIEDYVAGKTSIPDISTTTPAVPAPGKGPQSIKEAAKIAKQMLSEGKLFFGKK